MRILFVIMSVAACTGVTFAQSGPSKDVVNQDPIVTQEQIERLPYELSRPEITLKRALKVAEGYIRKERINLSAHYLAEAKLIPYGKGQDLKERHWLFRWVRYRLATEPEIIIVVSMEGKASRRPSENAASNNGMHPTANSAALMRETPANQRFVAAGDAGR